MQRILSAVLFSSLFAASPTAGFAADDPQQNQQIVQAKVAEFKSLFQKWSKLRPGMTVEEVEAIVGPLEHNAKDPEEALARLKNLPSPTFTNMPPVERDNIEVHQSCAAGGTTITFRLVFNSKRKLVGYWLDNSQIPAP